METRALSPVPPATPGSGPSSGRSSPWSAQAEIELRREAERIRNCWKTRCLAAENNLRDVRAALMEEQGRVQFMARNSSQFFREVNVLRAKLGRWDKRNWAELVVSALKGPRDGSQLDYTMDVRDCESFQGALKEIHRQRDEECCEWLQTHAFRMEKQLLGKMSHRKSNRRMFWENSLYKFDHSSRDAEGAPIRKREMMAADSTVRAPELYNPKAVLAAIREEETNESGEDRHVESEDRLGAEVRDVEATIVKIIDSAEVSACGGWASKGTADDPHWLMESMDGAGLSHAASGVRIVLFAGSVRKLNQSRHGVHNLAAYQATSYAEDHGVLMARCAFIRPQLCRIFKSGYVARADGTKIYVKFMLSADKSGICHLMGTRNMNYDAFGTQCDCKDSKDEMYDLTKDPLTHYDHLTFAKRVGRAHVAMHEALEEAEPEEWCVECDVCGSISKETVLAARANLEAMDEAMEFAADP